MFGLLICIALLFSSCNQTITETDGYAEVTLANGTVFTFELPSSGNDKIYANRTTSATDSSAVAYTVSALSEYDVPYESFYLKLVPQYTDSNGNTVGPTAVVRVTEYHQATEDTQVDSSSQPMSRTYNLSSSTSLSTQNYSTPLASDGTFSMNWCVGDEYAVKASELYSAYSYKTYSVTSVKVVATLK